MRRSLLQCTYRLCRTLNATTPRAEALASINRVRAEQHWCQLRTAAAALGKDKNASLGLMPSEDLSKTGRGGPGAETKPPKDAVKHSDRFGEVPDAARREEGPSQTEDHPAPKFKAAYVKGRPIQEDDTATAGMPQERPLTTPLGGLGNDPDDPEVEPVPTLGGLGMMDHVPGELGETKPGSNWGPEEGEAVIGETGAQDVDAQHEPGTINTDERGSTEPYEGLKHEEMPYKNPLG
mmetsp:Transcript_11979/g.35977  ORF Transcript_11979/g.35977 Transcript_11979/m.35977 type:complete len:236 (+) Transcript_11979:171-878(+)